MGTSPRSMRLLMMAAAMLIVVGFQVLTHIHWFRVHGFGSTGSVPCADERGGSVNRGVVFANGVLRPPPPLPPSLPSSSSVDSQNIGQVEIEADSSTPDAGCGDGDIDLLVAVLGAPTERSRIGRQTARETWITLPTGDTKVVVRFVLAKDKDGNIPQDLLDEAAQYDDLIFMDTKDAYLNLAAKVGLFFKWAVDSCDGDPLILKTDEDSFVHMEKLAAAIKEVPKRKLYWGKFLKGIPARKKDGGRAPDNYQNMHVWPDYASGAGYILSFDVAKAVAYPAVPFQWHEAEDRHVGVALFGYNITQVEDLRFSPWGQCDDSTFLLHYQRHPEMLKRRFRRVVAKQSMCGVPFQPGTEVCNKADPNKVATWTCPGALKVVSVIGATFGRVYSSGKAGSCSEGAEGLEPLEWCHAPTSKQVVAAACIGKHSCDIKADVKVFGPDPCKGERKHLIAALKCA